MAAVLGANPAIVATIAALSASAIQILAAIKQANDMNNKPEITVADWDALDANTQTVFAASAAKQAIMEGKRAAELAAPPASVSSKP